MDLIPTFQKWKEARNMGISEGGVANLLDLTWNSTILGVLTRQTNMQLVIVSHSSGSGGRQARNRQVLLELYLPIQLNQI
jgi:hypothetical protein